MEQLNKFKIGDYVSFEGITGTIVEVIPFDEEVIKEYEFTACYKIKVKTKAMGGFCFMSRSEEELTLINTANEEK